MASVKRSGQAHPDKPSDGVALLSGFAGKGATAYVVHSYTDRQIERPDNGGGRLISEQISHLRSLGFRVRSIKTHELPGLCRHYYRIQSKAWERVRRRDVISKGGVGRVREIRGTMHLLRSALIDIIGRIDHIIPGQDRDIFGQPDKPALVVFNSPYGIRTVSRFLRKRHPDTRLALYEHNIEWVFHEDKIGKGPVEKLLVWLIKRIELDCVEESDYVFCLSAKDRQRLLDEGIETDKVKLWVPMALKEGRAAKKPDRLKDKLVLGYIGTNYKPNILAVREIVRIAEKLPEDFFFVIVGSVETAFPDKGSMPANVMFTGHVPEVDDHLGYCDAFLNPKIGSDTGLEVKMFDYIRHGKPIISTYEGSRGLESVRHLTICSVEDMEKRIRNLKASR